MSFVKGTPTKTLYVHISPFEEAMFMAKNRNNVEEKQNPGK